VSLHWTKEDAPRWDADKQRLFGADELAAVGFDEPATGAALADEWWQVTDDDGSVLGYGWLDSEWGDAEITFVVGSGNRGRGVGAFILDRLEAEAAERGLNYIYNVVPDSHPNRAWMTHWLTLHGFFPSASGELRRQVRRSTAQAR
jgi:N-acetylglutamate synthase-like GNAT family acetyltransferase